YGAVVAAEGNKLTVALEQAGAKKEIDSFVERGGGDAQATPPAISPQPVAHRECAVPSGGSPASDRARAHSLPSHRNRASTYKGPRDWTLSRADWESYIDLQPRGEGEGETKWCQSSFAGPRNAPPELSASYLTTRLHQPGAGGRVLPPAAMTGSSSRP